MNSCQRTCLQSHRAVEDFVQQTVMMNLTNSRGMTLASSGKPNLYSRLVRSHAGDKFPPGNGLFEQNAEPELPMTGFCHGCLFIGTWHALTFGPKALADVDTRT